MTFIETLNEKGLVLDDAFITSLYSNTARDFFSAAMDNDQSEIENADCYRAGLRAILSLDIYAKRTGKDIKDLQAELGVLVIKYKFNGDLEKAEEHILKE